MITSKLKQELLNLNSVSELNEVIAFAREAVSMQTKASITVGSKVYVVQIKVNLLSFFNLSHNVGIVIVIDYLVYR